MQMFKNKLQILTTFKDRKTRYGIDRKPNLDIKAINGKPFKATYEYDKDNIHCLAIIEFNEVG